MVKCSPDPLNAVFSALADPTRRGITERLWHGPASVSELAQPYAVTLPAVVKHLAVLERAGLVEHWKEGRVRRYRLVPDPLEPATAWIARYTRFWNAQLGSLQTFLRDGGTA
jgi:DNA-binding transcriptional ArsR family regulator